MVRGTRTKSTKSTGTSATKAKKAKKAAHPFDPKKNTRVNLERYGDHTIQGHFQLTGVVDPSAAHYKKHVRAATGKTCTPDHLGRPRVLSLKTRKCILADGEAMRAQGQCVSRERVLPDGRKKVIYRFPNPEYSEGSKLRRCIQSGSQAAKKLARRLGDDTLACAPHLELKKSVRKVPVWTKNSNGTRVPLRDEDGKKVVEERDTERCVKRQGARKQCPLGQALYEVAVPERRGKVFKAGAPRGTLVSATIPEHSKYICGKQAPKNVIRKVPGSDGTLPPKLYKTSRIPDHPLNAYSSEAAKKAAAKKAAAKKAAAKKTAAKKTAAKKTAAKKTAAKKTAAKKTAAKKTAAKKTGSKKPAAKKITKKTTKKTKK